MLFLTPVPFSVRACVWGNGTWANTCLMPLLLAREPLGCPGQCLCLPGAIYQLHFLTLHTPTLLPPSLLSFLSISLALCFYNIHTNTHSSFPISFLFSLLFSLLPSLFCILPSLPVLTDRTVALLRAPKREQMCFKHRPISPNNYQRPPS